MYVISKLIVFVLPMSTEIKFPSIEIPKISFPTLRIPNLDEVPTTTWLIIIFVLVMFLLSCMSSRPEPRTEYISLHRESPQEGFESWQAVDTLDAGQGFSPKPSYSCSMQTRCLPGETDTGKWCIKEGCPEGTEQGIGLGKEFCYPKCILGYESDGGSRCWKKCPEEWKTEGDKCIRPSHTFQKDVIPCRGCLPPPPDIVPKPNLPIVVKTPETVVMTPRTSAFVLPTYMTDSITYPATHMHPVEKGDSTHIHPRTITSTGLIGGTLIVEPFGNSFHSKPILMKENFENSRIDLTQTNVVPTQSVSATSNKVLPPDNKPIHFQKSKKTLWRVEDRIDAKDLPCPLGYTLSGDKCYENCPPHYRDTGDNCALDRYAVERPTYDRGSGIPYASKRSKSLNVSPIDRGCDANK